MKLKKVLAIAMATVMTAAMLVGCGSKGGSNEGTKSAEVQDVALKVWVPEEEVEITKKMCDEFAKAHPEYKCTFDVSIVGIDESVNLLTTDPDLAADVMIVPSGSLSQVVEAGLILPIAYDIDNVKKLYGEGALEACTRDDKLYAVPSSPNSFFMYYNKKLFDENDVKSLEAMMDKDLGDGISNFSCTISNSWYIESFFYAAGCTLFGADGTDPTNCSWNDANGLEAGKYVLDLAKNPKYVEDLDGIAGALFKDGKLGALCSGTWSYPELHDALGDDLGACALPTIILDGKKVQLSNFADYKCHVVKASTKAPLAAQQLCEWFDNEANQLTRYTECSETPTCLSLQDNEEIAKNVAAAALIAQTEFATPQPSISQIGQYWDPVKAFGDAVINGDVTEANLQSMLDSLVESVTSKLVE